MEFQPIERVADAFQQSVAPEEIVAMCGRVLGELVPVEAAVELGTGMYNSSYRIDTGEGQAVILRVAPEPGRQFRSERELMRTEHASIPFLAPIAPMMPRLLGADFTHQVVGRDFLVQTMLPGLSGPDGLGHYPRRQWPDLYRQIGTIAKSIHGVRGVRFGALVGANFEMWSEAVVAGLGDVAADLDGVGLDSHDVRQVAEIAEQQGKVLDEIVEPRLLHGDLWTPNVMIDPAAAAPTITGVLDCDRTSWGDPAADWSNFMADRRPGTERDAFWDTYGRKADTWSSERRAQFYRARHVGAIRLERFRLGKSDTVLETYGEMRDVLEHLRTRERG